MIIKKMVVSRGLNSCNSSRQQLFSNKRLIFLHQLFNISGCLLKELRQYGPGCHMGGLWIGVVAFADDILLMSPSRSAMAKRLNICEDYSNRLNLIFSTDVDPSESKSKSIFMTGPRLRKVQKPAPSAYMTL